MALEQALSLNSATVGVITALPKEFIAACEVLGCHQEVFVDGRVHRLGTVRRRDNTGAHVLVVCQLLEMGNNSAAARTALLRQVCPRITDVIMCGIAGAVPNPQRASEHVRLGDIVVSNDSVVQYDFVREGERKTERRVKARPPSRRLLEIARLLEAEEHGGSRPWNQYISQGAQALGKEPEGEKKWQRPPGNADTLREFDTEHLLRSAIIGVGRWMTLNVDWPVIKHPEDPDRLPNLPRVFYGVIASANNLQKNPRKRNELRNQFRAKAIEMEGSGVADAAYQLDLDYFIVRGTVDYCNAYKNDQWHSYSAIAAAAYTRALLESTPLPSLSTGSASFTAPASARILVFAESVVEHGGSSSQVAESRVETAVQRSLEQALSDLVEEQARKRADVITDMIASWEFEKAISLGRDLEAWLDQNATKLQAALVKELHVLLIRVEMVKASEDQKSGIAPDTTKAEQLIKKVRGE